MCVLFASHAFFNASGFILSRTRRVSLLPPALPRCAIANETSFSCWEITTSP